MKPLEIGDVIEIKTPKGLGYAQLTHSGYPLGDCIRVLPGLFESQPDLSELVLKPTMLHMRTTLRFWRKRFRVVTNQAVPPFAKQLPPFKQAHRNPIRPGTKNPGELNWALSDIEVNKRLADSHGEDLPPGWLNYPWDGIFQQPEALVHVVEKQVRNSDSWARLLNVEHVQ